MTDDDEEGSGSHCIRQGVFSRFVMSTSNCLLTQAVRPVLRFWHSFCYSTFMFSNSSPHMNPLHSSHLLACVLQANKDSFKSLQVDTKTLIYFMSILLLEPPLLTNKRSEQGLKKAIRNDLKLKSRTCSQSCPCSKI